MKNKKNESINLKKEQEKEVYSEDFWVALKEVKTEGKASLTTIDVEKEFPLTDCR